jgi:hypothetical protein
MSLVAAPPWVLVTQWSARSQERARRNAMAACTDLAGQHHRRSRLTNV